MAFTSSDALGHRPKTAAFALAILAVAAISTGAPPAFAQRTDRWAALDGQAAATLPTPQSSGRIAGATISCEARNWTLTLDLAGQSEPPTAGTAALKVDGSTFETKHSVGAGTLTLTLPKDAIGPLKQGTRLIVDLSGALEASVGDAVFPLRGSRIAITAAEELCSRRDMSAYSQVTFTPYSSYLATVRDLRADDIRAFKAATASDPVVTAAMVELGEGRRLLFSRLCGSSWYFGLSGCNITGFAPKPGENGGEDGWRAVYDTENVLLHTDPKSAVGGWADLVTLPTRSDGHDLVWRWNGNAYALFGPLPDDSAESPTLQAISE